MNNLSPVTKSERFEILDIVRGFALYGVLMANMVWFFSGYGDLNSESRALLSTAGIDSIMLQLETILVVNKFVTIFSFLFGIGFAIQLRRIIEKGKKFNIFYIKRMLWLLLFGILHFTFLLYTDILHLYAMLGLLLIFWTSLSQKQLLVAGLIFSIFMPVIAHITIWSLPAILGEGYNLEVLFARKWDYAAQQHSSFINGTYLNVIKANLADVWAWLTTDDALTTGMGSFGLFLLGYATGRSNILVRIKDGLSKKEINFFKKIMILSLVVGIVCQGILELDIQVLSNQGLTHVRAVRELLWRTGVLSLALFYTVGLVLLFNRNSESKFLQLFAPVGRMALTNYLLQSVFGVFIFYGFGLGYYGKIGPAISIVLTTLIFVLQILYSRWWLRIFRFGPAEWLWRALTYGKLESIRLDQK